jgi:hypothetical protein
MIPPYLGPQRLLKVCLPRMPTAWLMVKQEQCLPGPCAGPQKVTRKEAQLAFPLGSILTFCPCPRPRVLLVLGRDPVHRPVPMVPGQWWPERHKEGQGSLQPQGLSVDMGYTSISSRGHFQSLRCGHRSGHARERQKGPPRFRGSLCSMGPEISGSHKPAD